MSAIKLVAMSNTFYVGMPDDYRAMADEYYRHFSPETLEKRFLVDDMVHDSWIRQRARTFKSAYVHDPSRPGLAEMYKIATDRLHSLERNLAKNLVRLQKLQSRRARASKSEKLASFRQTTPRLPAPPKTEDGQWIN